MRVDALDDFAVEVKDQPQDAMRGWMLRAEIDREITNWIVAHVKSVLRRSSLRVALGLLRHQARHSRSRPPTATGNRTSGIPG